MKNSYININYMDKNGKVQARNLSGIELMNKYTKTFYFINKCKVKNGSMLMKKNYLFINMTKY